MKVLKAEEMKTIDQQASSQYGIPSIVLMENAGIRTVEAVEEILGETADKHVIILAGKGNNGGDGLVIARHLLNAGAQVETFLLGNAGELTPDSSINYHILQKMNHDIYPLHNDNDLNKLMLALLSCDLIIDSMYGIGFKGSLGDFEAQIVRMVNWSRAPVVAVDIPSGVEADSGRVHGEAVKASHTVTFALPKIGLLLEPGKTYTGTLSVADISIPRQLLQGANLKTNLITDTIVKPYFPARPAESHKGSYGHALVVGGAIGLTGAVIMASYAALRAGAGLVTAALPESLVPVVETGLLEVMTTPLAETGQSTIALEALPAIEDLLGTVSACAIGPGMSRYTEARAVVEFVLERAGVPVVIDADGLNAIAGDISILKDRQIPVVLTPHPGEMARLAGKSIEDIQNNRLDWAREFAQEWGVTLVLKGNKTVVATPAGETYINITGNPGMATGGSGDVLCGMITGFIAQGMNPQAAAVAGVYLHGLAGDEAAQTTGERGLIAGDLIAALPRVISRLEE